MAMTTRRNGIGGKKLMSRLFVQTVPAIVIILVSALALNGQSRPFVFSFTPASTPKAQVLVDYDIGVGEETFRSNATNGPEHRLGIQASLHRWTFLSRFGIPQPGGSYDTSKQGEVLYSILTPDSSGVSLAAGFGVLHEARGVDVLLSRIAAGRDFQKWRLQGNVVFQRPLSSNRDAVNRDAVDLITTAGWSRRLGSAFSLGVEGIGEDLEGFWNPAEAEGGARLLIGPSLHVAPPDSKWQFSVAGGPSFHPTNTGRSSDALRYLPQDPRSRGFAIRMSFASTF
jgi:hypothetical protein